MRIQASVQGMARVEEIRPERTEGRRLAAIAMVLAFGLFVSLMGVSPARADHVGKLLDCGDHGTFTVDGRSDLPSGFDAPSPWTGLFLLENTTQLENNTQVFKAYSITKGEPPTQQWVIRGDQRHDRITCTMDFHGSVWTFEGVLGPRRP